MAYGSPVNPAGSVAFRVEPNRDMEPCVDTRRLKSVPHRKVKSDLQTHGIKDVPRNVLKFSYFSVQDFPFKERLGR